MKSPDFTRQGTGAITLHTHTPKGISNTTNNAWYPVNLPSLYLFSYPHKTIFYWQEASGRKPAPILFTHSGNCSCRSAQENPVQVLRGERRLFSNFLHWAELGAWERCHPTLLIKVPTSLSVMVLSQTRCCSTRVKQRFFVGVMQYLSVTHKKNSKKSRK